MCACISFSFPNQTGDIVFNTGPFGTFSLCTVSSPGTRLNDKCLAVRTKLSEVKAGNPCTYFDQGIVCITPMGTVLFRT